MSADDLNELRDEVAAVLAEHRTSPWRSTIGNGWTVKCSCGQDVPEAEVQAHKADALLPLLARRIEAARAAAEESARTAWAVHSEHVEYMNRLLMHREAVAEERGLAEGEARVERDAKAWQDNYDGMFARWVECDTERLRLKDELRDANLRLRVAAMDAALAESTGREGGSRAKGGLIAPRADVMPFLQGGIDCYDRPGGPETAPESPSAPSGDSRGADEGTGTL